MDIDLLAPAAYERGQPFDQMLWLQEHQPISWHREFDEAGPGFWAITRYADVKAILADPVTFSSEPTTQIPDALEYSPGQVERMLIHQDAPRHTAHRKFLSPEFVPSGVRTFAPAVERVVTEIIDDVAEQGACDLAADVAGRLASFVTADLLGLPRQDVVDLYSVGDRVNNARSVTEGDGLVAMNEMGAHALRVWESRTATPRDDVVTRLAHGEIAGVPMNEAQFILDFLLLIVAGGDTTRNVVSGGMQALFDHPKERATLQADPSLIPTAVEEMLRWTTPIVYQRRRATSDCELRAQPIRSGEKVVMFFGAANRDPEVFEDPLRFDVRRDPNPHVAFGFGSHFCLGAYLARQELTVMFRELLRRLPDMQPAGDAVWQLGDAPIAPIIVGPKRMPVTFTPSRREATVDA